MFNEIMENFIEFMQPIGIILWIALAIMIILEIFYPSKWYAIRASIAAFCTGLVFCDIFKHKLWSEEL